MGATRFAFLSVPLPGGWVPRAVGAPGFAQKGSTKGAHFSSAAPGQPKAGQGMEGTHCLSEHLPGVSPAAMPRVLHWCWCGHFALRSGTGMSSKALI